MIALSKDFSQLKLSLSTSYHLSLFQFSQLQSSPRWRKPFTTLGKVRCTGILGQAAHRRSPRGGSDLRATQGRSIRALSLPRHLSGHSCTPGPPLGWLAVRSRGAHQEEREQWGADACLQCTCVCRLQDAREGYIYTNPLPPPPEKQLMAPRVKSYSRTSSNRCGVAYVMWRFPP